MRIKCRWECSYRDEAMITGVVSQAIGWKWASTATSLSTVHRSSTFRYLNHKPRTGKPPMWLSITTQFERPKSHRYTRQAFTARSSVCRHLGYLLVYRSRILDSWWEVSGQILAEGRGFRSETVVWRLARTSITPCFIGATVGVVIGYVWFFHS